MSNRKAKLKKNQKRQLLSSEIKCSHVVYVGFVHEWWDLRLEVDSKHFFDLRFYLQSHGDFKTVKAFCIKIVWHKIWSKHIHQIWTAEYDSKPAVLFEPESLI